MNLGVLVGVFCGFHLFRYVFCSLVGFSLVVWVLSVRFGLCCGFDCVVRFFVLG